MNETPFLPGDMLSVRMGGQFLKPAPTDLESDELHDHRWTRLKTDELVTVVAVGHLYTQSESYDKDALRLRYVWRWYFMLHNSTGRYGWTTINVAKPQRLFRHVDIVKRHKLEPYRETR